VPTRKKRTQDSESGYTVEWQGRLWIVKHGVSGRVGSAPNSNRSKPILSWGFLVGWTLPPNSNRSKPIEARSAHPTKIPYLYTRQPDLSILENTGLDSVR
jgi:hypothetical protein